VISLLLLAELAFGLDKTLCFQYAPDFWVSGLAAGDRWTNGNPRAARGIRVRLDEVGGATSGVPVFASWDGATPGCHTFTVDPLRDYEVVIRFEAEVNGIQLRSYDHPSPLPAGWVAASTEAQGVIRDRVVAVLGTNGVITNAPATYTLSHDGHVPYMAVASLIFFLNDWNLPSGTTVAFYPYVGVQLSPGATMQTRPMFPTWSGTMNGWPTRQKFNIAHELGHVISTLRVGGEVSSAVTCDAGYNPGYYRVDAGGYGLPYEDGCRAERYPENPDEQSGVKGMLTMEYQALSLREGWADFVAAYTFNYVSQDDCAFGEWGYVKNFDLDDDDGDGDINEAASLTSGRPDYNWLDYDNSGAPSTEAHVIGTYDGWLSCDGGPPLTLALCAAWGLTCNPVGVSSYDPLNSDLKNHARNLNWSQIPLTAGLGPDWLESVYGLGECGIVGGGLANRSTAFDWERFFWDLATEHDVPAETLSDLLLNLDPVTLDPDDNGGGVNDQCGSDTTADDVVVRLPAAAANTWCSGCPTPGPLTSAVAAEVEHGQDH
jgi:hypothetical protein